VKLKRKTIHNYHFLFRFQSEKIKNQENTLQLDNKKFFRTKRTSLKDTKVSRLKMPYDIKVNANGLLESSVQTNVLIQTTKNTLKQSNMPKVEGRNGGEDDVMENIVIENLIYTGKEPIFDGKLK
jgi:hypothetical protein